MPRASKRVTVELTVKQFNDLLKAITILEDLKDVILRTEKVIYKEQP